MNVPRAELALGISFTLLATVFTLQFMPTITVGVVIGFGFLLLGNTISVLGRGRLLATSLGLTISGIGLGFFVEGAELLALPLPALIILIFAPFIFLIAMVSK